MLHVIGINFNCIIFSRANISSNDSRKENLAIKNKISRGWSYITLHGLPAATFLEWLLCWSYKGRRGRLQGILLIIEGIMPCFKTNITLQWLFVKKQLESLCALGKMRENEVNDLKEKTRLVKIHSEVSSTINQLEPILKETRGLKTKFIILLWLVDLNCLCVHRFD